MMRIILSCTIGMLFMGAAYAQTKTVKPAAPKAGVSQAVTNPLKNSKDSASYALGIRIAQNLENQGLGKINIAILQRALADQLQKKKVIIPETALNQCIEGFVEKANEEKLGEAKKQAKAFLEANAKRPGVITLPSGLQYEVIKNNPDGAKPVATDQVKCHYHGTLIDGTVFDSSIDRGEPIVFSVGGVIRGWQEVLQLMTVGSKWKVYIPADLAYGDSQAGPKIGPGSTLIFDLELISIEK
ncbi:FKBP-type peptidyl-prolyl cis-trans isomerase FklB [Sediminibacterium goheungense]|uniref:Peptidyl-prolyl cis-trans isomerase n=2 Tax=Sediminibacterium goheungense TaxID=1086393 RepID=A0A4R6IV34_9BACT|nr:FKBP-type peptidyl-prolyl cis-trans isomerase FklB [Sediminibacterium goheungense]